MKGDPKVVRHLNAVLKNELTVIYQFFVHSRMLKNWGLEKFAEHEYQESIEEMKHADLLIDRILFLEGTPVVQELHRIQVGKDVPGLLKSDLDCEHRARTDLQGAIKTCEQVQDYVTRDLFQTIMADEEHHVDWIETQIERIRAVGLENYLQSWMDMGK
ncbi:MAG: bacterioferritin [Proteobacteria bacterium]|nr:bacterioferritin [Pseudomonadota bacterium]